MAKGLILSGNKFLWKGTEGFTDISDLGLKMWPGHFYIHSHKTGAKILFICAGPFYENEELGGYKYIAPAKNVSVTLFND